MQFDPDVKKVLRRIFDKRTLKADRLVRVLDVFFISPLEVFRLQEVLRTDEAQAFLLRSRRAAPSRFEGLLKRVFASVYRNLTDDGAVRGLFRVAASEAYYRVARSFFHAPVTRDFYEYMEDLIFREACRDGESTLRLVELLGGQEFFFLRRVYALAPPEEQHALAGTIMSLGRVNPGSVRAFLELAVLEDFQRFTAAYRDDVDIFALFRFVASYLEEHGVPGILPEVITALSSRPVALRLRRGNAEATLRRIGGILGRFSDLEDESSVPRFLRLFAGKTGRAEHYIFDTVLRLDRNRAVSLVSFFVSDAFAEFFQRYRFDEDIRLFMVRNAVRCVVDFMPPRFRSRAFGRLILSILLRGRLPRHLLNRRALFISYFTETNSSTRLSHLVLEFIFYDFVYLTLADYVDEERISAVPRYLSSSHRLFAEAVDNNRRLDGSIVFSAAARRGLYDEIIRRLGDDLWNPLAARFPDGAYWIRVVRSVAEESGCVDIVLAALEVLDPELLEPYAEHLLGTWLEEPGQVHEAARPNAFYALPFERAKSTILEYTLPLVGSIPIYPADWAKTEGRAIYLPKTVDFFLDDPAKLDGNRNLTMYVYLALHECGHLLGGSFLVRFGALAQTKRHPELLRLLFNYFEDYRIEKLLEGEEVHPIVPELFDAGRRYFAETETPTEPLFVFLADLTDTLHFDRERYDQDPGRHELVDAFHAGPLSCDGYSSLADFSRSIAVECRSMVLTNPFSALRLADHVYRVVEPWIETATAVMADHEQNALATILEGNGDHATYLSEDGETPTPPVEGSAGIAPPEVEESPASRGGAPSRGPTGGRSGPETSRRPRLVGPEDLEALYDEANAHPERFTAPISAESPFSRLEERERSASEEEAGSLVDDMRHTAADYRAGVKQVDGMSTEDRERLRAQLLSTARTASEEAPRAGTGGDPGPRIVSVKSYDPSTHRRLKRSQIREFIVSDVDQAFLHRHERYASITRRIHRMLERMFPQDDLSMESFSSEDGDLDVERVIDLIVDYDHAVDQAILVTEDEDRPLAEVVIGLDISGSTERPVGSGSGDLIIDMEKHFALIFYDALRALSVTPRVFAFNSVTGTNVYRPAGRESISAFLAADANRDGDFLRYVSQVLLDGGADRRFFFLISDGQPAAVNYEGQEAFEDTIVAMREVVRTGTRLIYLNVDPSENNYFDLFRREASAAIRCIDASRLPGLVPQLVHEVAAGLR